MSTPSSMAARVRSVVLVVLLLDVAAATAIAAIQTVPRGPLGLIAMVAVLAGHAVAHGLALRAAVTPWIEDAARTRYAAVLLGATLLAWPVLSAQAEPGDEPWAWLLGFTIGALVVLPRWAAPAAGFGGAALVLVGAGIWGGSVRDALVFAVLTGHGRPAVLRQALTSGARGFLAKGAPGSALADVVRRVHAGGRYVDPVLAADALTLPGSPLSTREAEVLAVAGEDRPVREVARALYLSPGTVRNHLSSAAQKLGVHGRATAWRAARDQGWI